MSSQDAVGRRTARPRWFGPAVMLAVLVLIGVLALGIRVLVTDENTDTSAAGPTNGAPATSGPAQSSKQDTGTDEQGQDEGSLAWYCQQDLSDDDGSVSNEPPAVEEWVSAGYNVVPFSEFGGCQKQDSGLRVGYAHTEAGALMAAATYSVALDPSASEEAAEDLEVAVAEGSNRDLLAEKAQRIREGLEEGSDGLAASQAALLGYVQNSYQQDSASYQLIYSLAGPDGSVQQIAGQVDVVWEDGDWKLDPASGTELISGGQYQGQPYIEWGPRN